MQQQPNVILIMTDQHRADALACAGNTVVQTPNIDTLASGGVMFNNAYCQSPVCMASRAAIHTGRYPRQCRVPSMGILPPEEITIAETLKRAGYATGMFGKLHFTPQSYTHQVLGSDRPLDVSQFLDAAGIGTPWTRLAAEDPAKKEYGFDESVGVEDSLWGHYYDWLEEVSPEHLPSAIAQGWGAGRDGMKYGNPEHVKRMFREHTYDLLDSDLPAELSASRFITERSIDFIRRNTEKPFFVHCSYVDPHHPFNAPAPFNRMYNPDDMVTPPEIDTSFYPGTLRGKVWEEIERMQAYPDELWRWATANYYGMVSNIDDCVGRLLSTLDELGLRENTIILFMADHGEHLGHHRRLYKGTPIFDDIMRIPFIVNWQGASSLASPGVDAGRQVDELVQEIDVYPTLMSLLNLPIHGGVQGHDLTPLLKRPDGAAPEPAGANGKPAGPPWGDPVKTGMPGAPQPVHSAAPAYDSVFCGADDLPSTQYVASLATRTKDWKLIYFPHSRNGMMFNLKDDPGETINLYDDPGYASQRNELTANLLDMHDVMKDPLPYRLTQA